MRIKQLTTEVVDLILDSVDLQGEQRDFIHFKCDDAVNEKITEYTETMNGASNNLTKREKQIIHYVAAGFITKQIASKVYLSPRTVESLLIKIKSKLNVKTLAQAVTEFTRFGLMDYDLLADIENGKA